MFSIKRWIVVLAGIVLGGGAAGPSLVAQVVQLQAVADTTLYSEGDFLSNGMGQHVLAGTNNFLSARRALIRFEIAPALPAGATVLTAELTLQLSRTKSGPRTVTLHRLGAAWGEAGSDAGGMEGGGTQALDGDATWVYRQWPATPWLTAGGEFVTGPSASESVGGPCLPENGQTQACVKYRWGSTPQMVADVQTWLDDPAQNFGWILVGQETSSASAKRFDSRTHPAPANRPSLRVVYTAPAPAGSVPDGADTPGTPLAIEKLAGGMLKLTWDPSCVAGDDDYAVYVAPLSDVYGYGPESCSTAGQTELLVPSAGPSVFYVVVPRNAEVEGSYGVDGADGQRPPAAGAPCAPQAAGPCS